MSQLNVSAVVQKEINELSDYLLETAILEAMRSEKAGDFRYLAEMRAVTRIGVDELRELIVEKHPNSVSPDSTTTVIYAGDGILMSCAFSTSRVSTSLTAKVWGPDKNKLRAFCRDFRAIIEPHRMLGATVSFHLAFANPRSGMAVFQVEEIVDEVIHDEAYPDLAEGAAAFVRDYLASPEAVLILQGPPGTGKTRLMRYLFSKMQADPGVHAYDYDDDYPAVSRRSPSVLYTGDDNLFKNDELFTTFMSKSYQALLVEDADHLLTPRSDGNRAMRQFLTLSDGIVRNPGKKLIFSTNLRSIKEIDDALLRPGRCFRWVSTRPLALPEADRLLQKICTAPQAALNVLLTGEHRNKEYTLAEIYKAASVVKP